MAINQNHLFEDLDGIKCAIVEKNADQMRVNFLKDLLEFNHYTVMVVPSPPPKAAAAPPAPAGPAAAVNAEASATPPAPPPPAPVEPPPPTTFTVGVTDVMFNPTNAIFGRLLKTHDGKVVTMGYWQQKDSESREDTPYFDGR